MCVVLPQRLHIGQLNIVTSFEPALNPNASIWCQYQNKPEAESRLKCFSFLAPFRHHFTGKPKTLKLKQDPPTVSKCNAFEPISCALWHCFKVSRQKGGGGLVVVLMFSPHCGSCMEHTMSCLICYYIIIPSVLMSSLLNNALVVIAKTYSRGKSM